MTFNRNSMWKLKQQLKSINVTHKNKKNYIKKYRKNVNLIEIGDKKSVSTLYT